ncbi:MAG TPA: hypothetical protein VL651_14970 [Bacteroidia bacterium]|jgi:hypothetical protein|nr:hypothetical protein [Bacteroidia bacterium]
MNDSHSDNKPVTTIAQIKNVRGWENMDDELAEKVTYALQKLATIFYTSIAKDMNLNLPDEVEVKEIQSMK